MYSKLCFVRCGKGPQPIFVGMKWVETAPFGLIIHPIEAQSLRGAFGTTADSQNRHRAAKKPKKIAEEATK